MVANCGAVVCSFSISHATDSMNRLCQCGVRVLGCGYFYDQAGPDGILVDCYGVSMKADQDCAVVVWGSDELYSEHAIWTDSFDSRLHTVNALDVVPMQHSDCVDGCISIVWHASLVVSSTASGRCHGHSA